ncbi:hypothetical protein [Corallococcus macrosporus]|uniref:hypothetical protein n=1 Tax=Corallococcus macrosporus TaxID=35 RepID=UPI0011D26614|nr:hypothetical protein [Corallococcus macrosporus]
MLEDMIVAAGTTIVRIAFAHSFFVSIDAVRARTPYFPNVARKSRQHYPGLDKGATAIWQGREVELDFNHWAQSAWQKYTGRQIARKSGYGVRHIWGHPWDPNAYTAGWNLCYMPFWVGMLTEEQHPHPLLERAIRQASFDLFFREQPVCDPPAFVGDQGLDLVEFLGDQPILLLTRSARPMGVKPAAIAASIAGDDPRATVRSLRKAANKSWTSLQAAARELLGEPHTPFNSPNVRSTAKSTVRRMAKATGLSLPALRDLLDSMT